MSRVREVQLAGALAVVSVLSSCSTGPQPMTIDYVELLPSGTRMFVYLNEPTCGAVVDYRLEERSSTVVVEVFYISPPDGSDCRSGADVTLSEPLGDRTVLDANTGDVDAA